ncbi:MAG: outer membrane beta-barrel protein [Pseudomonadota bacterium]
MTALGAATALALCAVPAQAGVPGVDFYVGAGIGQSNADISADDLGVSDFDKKDTAWKLYAGARALSFGAELNYIDLGKPSGGGAEFKYKAFAGYGLYYLPLPLPILDVYLKAGLARIDTKVPSADLSDNDTKFSYGGGLQLKFGSYAIRAEYEQFKVESAKPKLLTLGFSKYFL